MPCGTSRSPVNYGRGIPAWEVLLFRSAVIVCFCLGVGGRAVRARAVATPIKRVLLLRATITLVAWLCYYSAARALPLAQLLTLYFAAPVITTLLAVPLLGERVPPSRWASVACGFAPNLLVLVIFRIIQGLAGGALLPTSQALATKE